MRVTFVRRVVQGIVVVGTIFALMLAGGAPTENTHAPQRSSIGAE